MDKETLSNYGWIVICTLVLAVMIALATPFGEYVKDAVWSTTNGLNDTLNKNMEIAGLSNSEPATQGLRFGEKYITTTHTETDFLYDRYFVFYEDGSSIEGDLSDDTLFDEDAGTHIYSDTLVTGNYFGDIGLQILENGTKLVYDDGEQYLVLTLESELPAGATLEDGSFLTWEELKTKYPLKITDTSINDDAFNEVDVIVNLVVPETVTYIGEYAFCKCTTIKNIFLSNTAITTINNRAFRGSTLQCIGLPDTLTTIKLYAFEECELGSIIIPASVTSIETFAFAYCENLENIIYEGTVEQWNNISKGDFWNIDVPATHVTCSDGTVAL